MLQTRILFQKFALRAGLVRVLLFLLLSTYSFASESQEDAQAIARVESKYGPVVGRDRLPESYRELENIVDHLNEAQRSKLPKEFTQIKSRVMILDCPVGDLVVTNRISNPKSLESMIFITTGFLKDLFVHSDQKGRNADDVALKGMLAHELSHRLDKVDEHGLEQNHSRALVAQAREIRADADAVELAREAGYPEDSVYQGLRRLAEQESSRSGFVHSAIDDHPPPALRLSSQRLILTDNRYKRGIFHTNGSENIPEALHREIISDPNRLWSFVEPANISEAVERALNVPSMKQGGYYKYIEFNRLILTIDRMLAGRGDKLTTDETAAIRRLFEDMVKEEKKYPAIMTQKEIRQEFNIKNGSANFREYLPHRKAVETLSYYRSTDHKQWIRRSFLNRWGKHWWGAENTTPSWSAMSNKARLLTQIMAPADVFQIFDDQLRDTLVKELHDDKMNRIGATKKSNAEFNFSGLLLKNVYPGSNDTTPMEMDFRLANLVWKIRPEIGETTWLSYLIDPKFAHGTSVIFPLIDKRNEKTHGLGIVNQRFELASDPRKKDLLKTYKQVLQEIWDHRGYYGAVDVVMRDMNVDWDTVMQGLGIPREQGMSQIRSAVKQFTRSHEYTALLSTLKDVISAPPLRDSFRTGTRYDKQNKAMWLDKSLRPYLAGEMNSEIGKNLELKTIATNLFERAYLVAMDPNYALKQVEHSYVEYLNAHSNSSSADLAKQLYTISSGKMPKKARNEDVSVLADAIDHSNWEESGKKSFLNDLFINSFNDKSPMLLGDNWVSTFSGNDIETDIPHINSVIQTLKKYDVVQDHYDFFRQIRQSAPMTKALVPNPIFPTPYLARVTDFSAMLEKALATRLKAEQNPEKKKALVLQFSQDVLTPGGEAALIDNRMDNTSAQRRLKRAITNAADGLPFSNNERLQLFRALTHSGPSVDTDRFFSNAILPIFEKESKTKLSELLLDTLRSDSIESNNLKVTVAKKALEPRLLALELEKPAQEKIARFVEDVQQIIPKKSGLRDAYLEDIAWRLRIHGEDLKTVIEPLKSYNWRSSNPFMVNAGSELVEYISQMSERSRTELIEHLLNPIGELPDSVTRELESKIYDKLSSNVKEDTPEKAEKRLKTAETSAKLMKSKIEVAFLDSSTEEKIPIFELLLTAGRNGEMDIPASMRLCRKFLGYVAGSDEEILLKSFLEVIPEHERSVTLSYLLSHKNTGTGSITHLFEVFDSVGIKFGQLAAIWQLFGSKVAKEAQELKSNAKKLRKIDHEEIIKATLSPEEAARLDLSTLKNIANASMKVVDRVSLKGGGEDVALLIQRPHAESLIGTNLDLSKRFVERLQTNGLKIPGGMTQAILSSLGEQMENELMMKVEAGRLNEAKQIYASFNEANRAELAGWTFEVPSLVSGFKPRNNFLVLQYVTGADFDHIPAEVKKSRGPWVVKAALKSLFSQGWFNPDSHGGNFLIDEKNMKMRPLDVGQVSVYSKTGPWSSDDRYILARFIEAFGRSDSDAIVKFALEMAKNKIQASDRKRLKRAVLGVLQAPFENSSDRLGALTNVLAENGVVLKTKFSFGALKGLIILQGENYVSPKEFEAILEGAVGETLKEKMPRYLPRHLRNLATDQLNCIKSFIQRSGNAEH